jgi:hypothetical protein
VAVVGAPAARGAGEPRRQPANVGAHIRGGCSCGCSCRRSLRYVDVHHGSNGQLTALTEPRQTAMNAITMAWQCGVPKRPTVGHRPARGLAVRTVPGRHDDHRGPATKCLPTTGAGSRSALWCARLDPATAGEVAGATSPASTERMSHHTECHEPPASGAGGQPTPWDTYERKTPRAHKGQRSRSARSKSHGLPVAAWDRTGLAARPTAW